MCNSTSGLFAYFRESVYKMNELWVNALGGIYEQFSLKLQTDVKCKLRWMINSEKENSEKKI